MFPCSVDEQCSSWFHLMLEKCGFIMPEKYEGPPTHYLEHRVHVEVTHYYSVDYYIMKSSHENYNISPWDFFQKPAHYKE